MGVGGPAAVMAFPRSSARAADRRCALRGELGVPHRVLGGGSNLVVVDEGLDELVINTEDMRRLEVRDDGERHRRRRRQPDPHGGELLPRRAGAASRAPAGSRARWAGRR